MRATKKGDPKAARWYGMGYNPSDWACSHAANICSGVPVSMSTPCSAKSSSLRRMAGMESSSSLRIPFSVLQSSQVQLGSCFMISSTFFVLRGLPPFRPFSRAAAAINPAIVSGGGSSG